MELERMRKIIVFLVALALVNYLTGCRKDAIPAGDWSFYIPEHFPEPHYSFENNPWSYEKFSLGRDLFYDPVLSSDSSVSCSSCHAQTHGFADHNVKFSKGVNGSLGTRNAPSVINMAWQPAFMWDGRVGHLEIFSVAPITNPLEMNETMDHVVQKLNKNKYYQQQFLRAFDQPDITSQMVLFALTQFMVSIVSDNSKYDAWIRGETSFSTQEEHGLAIFRQHCASCHPEPMFTDYSYRNNGLDLNFSDSGRAAITNLSSDVGRFKVPSLRNVELTYPYMHDGRFYKLSQVLDHYSSQVEVNSPNLDSLLDSEIVLSDADKADLLSFLKTLTDYELMGNLNLSEPRR